MPQCQGRIPGGRVNLRRNDKLHGLFQQSEKVIMPWCRVKGYTNESLTDALMKYFVSMTNDNTGLTLGDLVNLRMDQLGYANYGTITDKLNAFFIAKTGKAHRGDSESDFWNSGLDFS